MKKIICSHCHQEAQYSPLEDLEIHAIKVFFCHPCKAEYLYWSDGFLASKSLYTKINNKTYRWTVGGGLCQLWYVKNPGIPGVRVNQDMENIKSFNFDVYPDITPYNIEQKIRNILIMS